MQESTCLIDYRKDPRRDFGLHMSLSLICLKEVKCNSVMMSICSIHVSTCDALCLLYLYINGQAPFKRATHPQSMQSWLSCK